MKFKVGDAVRAEVALWQSEDGLLVSDTQENCPINVCIPGDVGEVIRVPSAEEQATGPCVEWKRTGLVTDVGEQEMVSLVRRFPERALGADDPEQTGCWVWATCSRCDGDAQVVEHYDDGESAVVNCGCVDVGSGGKVLVKI